MHHANSTSRAASLFDLSGRVAVVTGSSRGIGRAIAGAMAAMGARVVISSRKAGPCDDAAAAINADCGEERALAVPASISEPADLQRLVDETMRRWGRIDVLVCNAASNPYYGPMLDIPDAAFRKTVDNNVLANLRLVGLVAPQMRERRDGVVIVVSSIGGLVGSPTIGAYNVTKAADMQLARNLAVELGPHNIRVNCIAPGLIRTDFSKALWSDPDTAANFARITPLGRSGEPEEIAGAAVFLAARAGAYVTGQTIVVDGGSTIFGT